MDAPCDTDIAPRGAFYQSVLAPHPSTPCAAVRSIEVRVARSPEGGLDLAYTVEGELRRVRLPRQSPARRADGLWRHTCFEAFVAPAGEAGTAAQASAYLELNFSPSTEWASYVFDRYREGMAPADGVVVSIALATSVPGDGAGHRYTLSASAQIAATAGSGAAIGEGPARLLAAPARVALAAVIEEADGRLSYWALRHPPGKPDFHHGDGFALRI